MWRLSENIQTCRVLYSPCSFSQSSSCWYHTWWLAVTSSSVDMKFTRVDDLMDNHCSKMSKIATLWTCHLSPQCLFGSNTFSSSTSHAARWEQWCMVTWSLSLCLSSCSHLVPCSQPGFTWHSCMRRLPATWVQCIKLTHHTSTRCLMYAHGFSCRMYRRRYKRECKHIMKYYGLITEGSMKARYFKIFLKV